MGLKIAKWTGISIAVLIILALTLTLYTLWPEGGIDARRAHSGQSTLDILRSSLNTDTLDIDLSGMRITCDAVVTDAQFNAMLDNIYDAQKGRDKRMDVINAYQAWIYDGYILIKANVTLAGLVPAQVSVTVVPSMQNNKLLMTVTSAKLGKLPMSAQRFLSFTGMGDSGSDTLEMDLEGLPSYVELTALEAERGRMTLNASIRVRSLADLEQAVRDIAPSAAQTMLENIMESLPAL